MRTSLGLGETHTLYDRYMLGRVPELPDPYFADWARRMLGSCGRAACRRGFKNLKVRQKKVVRLKNA